MSNFISGLFGLAGSAYGAYMDYKGVEAMNAANAAMAERQMAFQRESMQSRHQWEVEDLRKAGLNPILSAGGQPPVLSGSSAVMANKSAGFKELFASTAKMLSEVRLNKELVNTEKAKQVALAGSIPGINIPWKVAVEQVKRGMRELRNFDYVGSAKKFALSGFNNFGR